MLLQAAPIAERPGLPPGFEDKVRERLREASPALAEQEWDLRLKATLQFLHCFMEPDAPRLAPCVAVDAVWHKMIMHTADYRRFCESLGVPFIEHEPLAPGAVDAPPVARTVAFMQERGIWSDETAALWADAASPGCCGGHVAR